MPEKGLWTRTYSTRDQVPDRPVFTRGKNKFPSWDFDNFAITKVSAESCILIEESGLLNFPAIFLFIITEKKQQHTKKQYVRVK